MNKRISPSVWREISESEYNEDEAGQDLAPQVHRYRLHCKHEQSRWFQWHYLFPL